jgi:alanine dehydrogenase
MANPISDYEKVIRQFEKYQPQEALLKTANLRKEFSVGIPKELDKFETRIALRPEAVKTLTSNGHKILFETGAAEGIKYTDRDYSEAGATIVYSPQEVYSEADIVLKVAPPTAEEVSLMKPHKAIISALQLANLKPELLNAINKKRLTAFAFEFMQDRAGNLIVVRSMSEIAGSTVMLIAAEYLSSDKGKGIILGGVPGVPPTEVVILGGGTVAEYAARAALGLGASVKIFDDHLYKLRRLRYNLQNPNLFTSTLDEDVLAKALMRADAAIGAVRSEGGRTPCIVTDEMVSKMKPNSVIIDVSIDQGGCFETSTMTSHEKPVFKKYGVIHYCVPNIPARAARTATHALSNIFTRMMLKIGELGGLDAMILNESGFSKGIYSFSGEITNQTIAQKFSMRYKSLDLLISARKGLKD